MYSEEMDLQKRIKEAGWKVFYLPAAEVLHYGGKSSDQIVAQRHILFQTSKIKYIRKHHGDFPANLLRQFFLSTYRWEIAIEAAKVLVGHKREMRKERIREYAAVLRSGLRG
jgi:GT2 family glycosyltransferase